MQCRCVHGFISAIKLGSLCAVAWNMAALALAGDVACLEIRPETTPALVEAARACGLNLIAGPADATSLLPPVVIWELRDGRGVSDAWAEALGKYVQEGGAILLSFGKRPGKSPMRLASLAPTTGWHPQSGGGDNRHDRLRLAGADEAFFGVAAEKLGLELPFFHEIRPFHGVERGQARYDRFERPAPWIPYTNPGDKVPTLPPDANWWSRSLINRDWQIRARGDDVRGSPLLLTGRYGAGRGGRVCLITGRVAARRGLPVVLLRGAQMAQRRSALRPHQAWRFICSPRKRSSIVRGAA